MLDILGVDRCKTQMQRTLHNTWQTIITEALHSKLIIWPYFYRLHNASCLSILPTMAAGTNLKTKRYARISRNNGNCVSIFSLKSQTSRSLDVKTQENDMHLNCCEWSNLLLTPQMLEKWTTDHISWWHTAVCTNIFSHIKYNTDFLALNCCTETELIFI